jgi:hypothetical protein
MTHIRCFTLITCTNIYINIKLGILQWICGLQPLQLMHIRIMVQVVNSITLGRGGLWYCIHCDSNDHLDMVLDRNLADPYHHQTAHHTRCNRSMFSADTALKFLISLEAVREENLTIQDIMIYSNDSQILNCLINSV